MTTKVRWIIILLVGLSVCAGPALAQMAPLSLVAANSPTILEANWMFETNQAAQTSPYDHRQLMVNTAGDVNGDGYEDILIGKRDYDQPGYTDAGRAWLFYGSAAGLSQAPDRVFDPPLLNTYGFFGAQVSTAGDLNGDGFDDIVIGMDNYDYSTSDEGAVFVWYGSSTGPSAGHNWMARGDNLYAHFGYTLDAAGDVNHDGYADLIVGAWRSDDNVIAHAYVWHGSAAGLGPTGLPSNADWVASDPHPGQNVGSGFGRLVRGIGDVNGDGSDDVLVGAYAYDGGVTNQGAVFVWYGSDTGLGPAGALSNVDWMAVGGQEESRFGHSGVDGVGDLNGDGYGDIAVGAYAYDNPEPSEGAVFVWYGSNTGLGPNGDPSNAGWRAEANVTAIMGYSVRPGGDANGDGFADLLVAAPSYPVSSGSGVLSGAGAWFVWFGSPTGLSTSGGEVVGNPENAALAGFGDQVNAQLGRDDICSADVDGDGKANIFAAAWAYDHPEQDEGLVLGFKSSPNYIFLPVVQLNNR